MKVRSLQMQMVMVNGMNSENLKNCQPIFRTCLKFPGWLLIMVLGSIWYIIILRYGQIHWGSLARVDPGSTLT